MALSMLSHTIGWFTGALLNLMILYEVSSYCDLLICQQFNNNHNRYIIMCRAVGNVFFKYGIKCLDLVDFTKLCIFSTFHVFFVFIAPADALTLRSTPTPLLTLT